MEKKMILKCSRSCMTNHKFWPIAQILSIRSIKKKLVTFTKIVIMGGSFYPGSVSYARVAAHGSNLASGNTSRVFYDVEEMKFVKAKKDTEVTKGHTYTNCKCGERTVVPQPPQGVNTLLCHYRYVRKYFQIIFIFILI